MSACGFPSIPNALAILGAILSNVKPQWSMAEVKATLPFSGEQRNASSAFSCSSYVIWVRFPLLPDSVLCPRASSSSCSFSKKSLYISYPMNALICSMIYCRCTNISLASIHLSRINLSILFRTRHVFTLALHACLTTVNV